MKAVSLLGKNKINASRVMGHTAQPSERQIEAALLTLEVKFLDDLAASEVICTLQQTMQRAQCLAESSLIERKHCRIVPKRIDVIAPFLMLWLVLFRF